MESCYDVPFVLKGNTSLQGDGYDLVYCGRVKLLGDVLSVYEAGTHVDGTDGRCAVFSCRIDSLDEVIARKYKSSSGRYAGGRIEFIGSFGQRFKEKVVMKMEFGEYYRMKKALQEIKKTL
jgi:hypothetical protein